MTSQKIKFAFEKARDLKLSGYILLADIDTAKKQCNGIGAAWMGGLCDVISAMNPAFLIPSMIHDMRYFLGGTEADRKRADDEFLANSLICVDDRYNWYNPCRYIFRNKAHSYHACLRATGKSAWRDADFFINCEEMQEKI